MTRGVLQRRDRIHAEVQAALSDLAVSLHARSLRHGKLGQAVLVQVSFPGDMAEDSLPWLAWRCLRDSGQQPLHLDLPTPEPKEAAGAPLQTCLPC